MKESHNGQTMTNSESWDKKLETAGWGLFFIWTGIAFLAHVGWGAGLLGAGIITLGVQAARMYFGLRLEGFWVGVGILFMMGGIWQLLRVQAGFMPVLCLIAGLTLLASIYVGRRRNGGLAD